MEELLSGEYEKQTIWMQATGKSREEARAIFREVKERAVTELVTQARTEAKMQAEAAKCTCPQGWFPADRELQLRALPASFTGIRHHGSCAKSLSQTRPDY